MRASTGWNVIKNFALFWTLTIAVGVIAGMVNAGQVADRATDPGAQGGRGAGRDVRDGDDLCAMICSVGLVAALILDLFLKKSSIVEHGPTGLLTQATRVE